MAVQRTDDPGVIEHRLLELAYTTDAKITAPVLAYYAACSIENAEKVLDDLVTRDRLRMEVQDDGTILYELPDRQRLATRPPEQIRALEPIRPAPLALHGGREANPGLAAVFSLLLPGAGQLYAGRPLAALLWFLIVSLGYTLIVPGVVLHIFCVVSAATSAQRLNSAITRLQLREGSAY